MKIIPIFIRDMTDVGLEMGRTYYDIIFTKTGKTLTGLGSTEQTTKKVRSRMITLQFHNGWKTDCKTLGRTYCR